MKSNYSQLINDINSANVQSIILIPKRREVKVTYKDGTQTIIPILPKDQYFLKTVKQNQTPIEIYDLSNEINSANIAANIAFIFIILYGISFILRAATKNISNTFKFLSKSTELTPECELTTRFHDVGGIDEIFEELEEIVSFLKEPDKLSKLGATQPKGILICGPPGTGKTLVAKAIAGESNVPFFNIAGSEFIELFVGIGASRVRNLFLKAKEKAPSIIFIDEIDTIGSRRGSSTGIANDEREQTLNQILTEMDGFEERAGVIVLAATNRLESIDDALLRPGRFDRVIELSLPDKKARKKILAIQSLMYPLEREVSLNNLSLKTIGFSGAGLKNLLNESAINAARDNKSTISIQNIERAFERITLGTPSKEITGKSSLLMAYRQISKALIAYLISDNYKIDKITIIPRSNRLGFTSFINRLDDEDCSSKSDLISRIKILLAPRAAEIIVLGKKEITQLSSNEFEEVKILTTRMIQRYGFSNIGPIYIDQTKNSTNGFNSLFRKKSPYSQKLKSIIDKEIITIVNQNLKHNIDLLLKKRTLLDELVATLIREETIEGDKFYQIVKSEINNK